MNPISDKKYTGDGGNEQSIFIKDARIGWRTLLNDPMKQLANDIAQYEYLESLGPRLGGQARRLLDNFIDKWDYLDEANPFYEEAITREASRAKWRHYYKAKLVYDLRQIQVQTGGPSPIQPDLLDDPIPEPAELDEFLAIIQETFQAASASYLEDQNAFTTSPRESLLQLADRFDEVALPLLTAGLMTTRGLALNQRRHIPIHIKRTTINAMMREDEKRFEKGTLSMDKEKLMALAQREEGFLLEFEAEMRAAGQVPYPRPVSDDLLHPPPPPPRPHRAVGDRLGVQPRDIRDRLGTRAEGAPTHDNRECHICKKPGHITRNCPTTTTPTAINNAKTGVTNANTMATHKATGHVCESCNKPGHTEAQRWSAHPELVPEALLKKRQQALSATARKRRKAADYVSPNYHFQGMALTYRRPHLCKTPY